MERKKKFLIIFSILLIIAIPSVIAISLIQLNPIRMTVYTANIEDSKFTVLSLDMDSHMGKAKVELKLKNTDTVSKKAKVIIQLYDSGGNLLDEYETTTKSVKSNHTVEIEHTFTCSIYDVKTITITIKDI